MDTFAHKSTSESVIGALATVSKWSSVVVVVAVLMMMMILLQLSAEDGARGAQVRKSGVVGGEWCRRSSSADRIHSQTIKLM